MPQVVGRALLIKIGNAADPEVFANLCGFAARTFNLSANEVDTTTADCTNPAGPVQKTSVPGILSRTFSGSGKFVSGGPSGILLGHVQDGTIFNADVVVPGVGSFKGPWMVSDFEFSGELEGNMEFSATFSAAGKLTFTAEV